MKKAGSLGLILVSAVMGIVLMGNLPVQSEEITAPSDTAGTDMVAAAETNMAPDTAMAPDTDMVSETNMTPMNTLLGSALPDDIDPASPLGQLARLVQAGVETNVILAYVRNSPRFFELDADGIIYLTDLGTPADIIEAVMEHDQQLIKTGIGTQKEEEPQTNAVEVTADEPPEVTVDDFYDSLAPYGAWVNIDGYGRCWRPTVVVYNTAWQPYCDNGHWVYTDSGWYWMSNYSWGWATFHYGRWFHHARYGWCWWPDTVWAPSWVYWRYNTDYCGWAPLPPRTVYRSGVGFVYRGNVVSAGFDFNLGIGSFTFVSTRHFCDANLSRHRIHRKEVERFYNRTEGFHRFDIDRRRHIIVNKGIPLQNITSVTKREIRPVSIRYSQNRFSRKDRNERLDRDRRSVIVQQPRTTRSGHSSSPRGTGSSRSENQANKHQYESKYPPVQSPGNKGGHPSMSAPGTSGRGNRAAPQRKEPDAANRNKTQDKGGSGHSVAPPAQTSRPAGQPSVRTLNRGHHTVQSPNNGGVVSPRTAPSNRNGTGSAAQAAPRPSKVKPPNNKPRPSATPQTTRKQVVPQSSGSAAKPKVPSYNNRTRPNPRVSRAPKAGGSGNPPVKKKGSKSKTDDSKE